MRIDAYVTGREEMRETARPDGDAGPREPHLQGEAETAPVIGFVDHVLTNAVRKGASDVHFEPFEQSFRIRYRIDGALHELEPPSPRLYSPVVARIKILADLNIAERRVPQDGRIRMTACDRTVDLRVNTMPTRFGESVVLRVLDRMRTGLDLDRLGLSAAVCAALRETLRCSNGMLAVTGPTGSGKTTTLYSALGELNRAARKILTVEDPVEFEIDGLVQIPVNHQVGLDFATILRALLRQDPDTIMVGEIRDLETARIAVRAALTGHLVLTTLHTGDSVSAVTRLINIGLEPQLIAAALRSVLAQRLLREICPQCLKPCAIAEQTMRALGLPVDDAGLIGHEGEGCRECQNTGYRGRFGVFELLRVKDSVREHVAQNSAPSTLRREAVRAGMSPLRQEGIHAFLGGRTTAEEVLRNIGDSTWRNRNEGY